MQQQKQTKQLIAALSEINEHVVTTEKKVQTLVVASKDSHSLSAVSVILYTFVSAILVIFFQRLLGRWL